MATAEASRRQPSRSIQSPYDFAVAVLNRLGAPLTDDNLKVMIGWTELEGGHWNNDAEHNPLNTTLNLPGSGDTGTQGNISVYRDWNQGVEATVKTLRLPFYDSVVAAFKRGNNWESTVDAINSSPWLPGGYGPTLGHKVKSIDPPGASANVTPPPGRTGVDGLPDFLENGASAAASVGEVITSPFRLAQAIWEKLSSREFWLSVGKIFLGIIAIILGIRFFAKNYA